MENDLKEEKINGIKMKTQLTHQPQNNKQWKRINNERKLNEFKQLIY